MTLETKIVSNDKMSDSTYCANFNVHVCLQQVPLSECRRISGQLQVTGDGGNTWKRRSLGVTSDGILHCYKIKQVGVTTRSHMTD